jgi:hypothetical protein
LSLVPTPLLEFRYFLVPCLIDIFAEQSFFGSEYRKERVIVTSEKAKLREINKIAFENLLNFKSEFFLNFIQNIIWKAYILELKINTL